MLGVFMWFVTCVVTVIAVNDVASTDLPVCNTTDFHYVYTQCDSDGGRWRVSVPKYTTCTGGTPQLPVRGTNCAFTCGPGEYLDINTEQNCVKCAAGQYSLGGGVLFNSWSQLPTGFVSRVNSFIESEDTNCSKTGWTAKGRYISAENTQCIAVLTYSASLVQAGDVTFEYQYIDDSGYNTMFSVEVRNSQCESGKDPSYLRPTERGAWKVYRVQLRTGFNYIYFRFYPVSFLEPLQHSVSIVRIKSIKITGVAFTSECTMCDAGSYSDIGASSCKICPRNTYSSQGSSTCTPCDSDSEYSEAGSAQCTQRPLCTAEHYIEYQTECTNGQTRTMYAWIDPRLCTGGVKLPAAGQLVPCPPCNVGMHVVNGTCQFCAPNQYSNGSSACMDCPGSTSPEIGVVYKQWSQLPAAANVTSFCMSLVGASGCRSSKGWFSATNYMQTMRLNADDVYLVLTMEVGGFRSSSSSDSDNLEDSSNKYYRDNDESSTQVAEISFVFETHCTSQCKFFFLKQSGYEKTELVQGWTGTNSQTPFRMKISSVMPVKFSWAFQKSSTVTEDGTSFTLDNDYARIYMINVTNTLTGGAGTCRHCPQGASQHGCIPCPDGYYIDPKTEQCTSCPPDTVISSSSAWGIDSCIRCDEGLIPYKSRRCASNCVYIDRQNNIHNFTYLPSIQLVSGPRLFSTSGHAYYHMFNISLCGGVENRPLAFCTNNMSSPYDLTDDVLPDVTSHVCESTILLPEDQTEPIVSVNPISLGDKLVRITDHTDRNISVILNGAGLQVDKDGNSSAADIYLLYATDLSTAACRHGRRVLVILRCDMTQIKPGAFEFAPHCSDGTCDGCNFVFILHTVAACPVCKASDFVNYSTTCIGGKKQIITNNNRSCNPLGVEGLPVVGQQTVECSIWWEEQWPDWLKVLVILVPVILVAGVCLFSAVIYCWCKNKTLEYKYMKLVESSSSRGQYSAAGAGGGELPAAETCALDEGEEDEEHFDVTKIRKPNKLFGKFNKSSNNHSQEDDETFENIRMSQKSLLA